MTDVPGRETRPAESTSRRSWYGLGTTITLEKNAFGRFLDDLVRVFADVSLASLPFLWVILLSPDVRLYGVKTGALLAWAGLVLGGTLLRGGWIRPLGTEVRGWVTLAPVLVGLRLVYYNVALAVATFGADRLAAISDVPPLAPVVAFGVGLLAVAGFPRVAEVVAIRFGVR